MPNLHRIRIEWAGLPIEGPGLTTFFTDELTGLPSPADFNAFFTSLAGLFPSGLSWSIPNDGDTIDAATGTLVGTWNNGANSVVSSTGSGAFAAGVGARVVWRTGVVRGGHRVRGTTFLCPLLASGYDGAGSLTAAALNTISTAADTLRTRAVPPVVWSRPRVGLGGASVGITSSEVPDRISWLRSRRT